MPASSRAVPQPPVPPLPALAAAPRALAGVILVPTPGRRRWQTTPLRGCEAGLGVDHQLGELVLGEVERWDGRWDGGMASFFFWIVRLL